MEITFQYSKCMDLIFHVLAHFHVNNASDLYMQEYVDRFAKHRNTTSSQFDLFPEARLEKYYNENFDRLGMINFYFGCRDLSDLKDALFSNRNFTEEDIECFINPFFSICEQESSLYFPFWDWEYQKRQTERVMFEKEITQQFRPYERIFRYYKKYAKVYFSFSLTRNGRGLYEKDNFSSAVPFPSGRDRIRHCFFQLFHEYTHQFTDALLNTNINMKDGTHDLSEKLVILTDYYLIKNLEEGSVDEYFTWIANQSGKTGRITETEFCNAFAVPSRLYDLMNCEIKKILECE